MREMLGLFFKKDCIHLFESGESREKERERTIEVREEH